MHVTIECAKRPKSEEEERCYYLPQQKIVSRVPDCIRQRKYFYPERIFRIGVWFDFTGNVADDKLLGLLPFLSSL
jgi:hypothetical protein